MHERKVGLSSGQTLIRAVGIEVAFFRALRTSVTEKLSRHSSAQNIKAKEADLRQSVADRDLSSLSSGDSGLIFSSRDDYKPVFSS